MVKGVRDIVTATLVFVLLALGQRRARGWGWVLLANAVIPLGDALAALTHGSTLATALSVHVSAAALVLLTALLLLSERPAAAVRETSHPSTPPGALHVVEVTNRPGRCDAAVSGAAPVNARR